MQKYDIQNGKCAFCGMGEREGLILFTKPINPAFKESAKNSIVFCEKHFEFEQLSAVINEFMKIHKYAKEFGDEGLLKLSTQVLEFYEENGINGHIVWNR